MRAVIRIPQFGNITPLASAPAMVMVMATVMVMVMVVVMGGCTTFKTQPLPDVDLTEQSPILGGRYLIEPGQEVVGELQMMRAEYEDTFVEIARTYGLGYDELVAANPGVDPWLPGVGTQVLLPTRFVLPRAPREGVVLNIASKRLFYYPPPDDGDAKSRVVETYPVGIGRAGWATPTGTTTVVSKARDPVWYVPKSVREEHLAAGDPLPKRVPPGPDNPLGAHVLGLGIPGYLLHGTNKPAGVGMRVSHGCVRLFPENIEYLYGRVEIGTPVRIVNQPYLFGRLAGDLVFEAHAPLEEDDRAWRASLVQQARAGLVGQFDDVRSLDEARVERIAADARGIPVSVIAGHADTQATVYSARRVSNVIERDRVADRSSD
jgi:L,D-transpeptidase ErfK/SrfK